MGAVFRSGSIIGSHPVMLALPVLACEAAQPGSAGQDEDGGGSAYGMQTTGGT